MLLASDQKKSIIFSSHITSDLERVANKVAILHKGKIQLFDELDAVKENVVKLTIYTDNPLGIVVPNVIKLDQKKDQVQCIVSKLDVQWQNKIEADGAQVVVTPMGLEDIFLEVTA